MIFKSTGMSKKRYAKIWVTTSQEMHSIIEENKNTIQETQEIY